MPQKTSLLLFITVQALHCHCESFNIAVFVVCLLIVVVLGDGSERGATLNGVFLLKLFGCRGEFAGEFAGLF
jgi:hypothetical protein